MRIDNWTFTKVGDMWTAPECWEPVLVGFVTGHPHCEDGVLQTSRLVGWDGFCVITRNSKYELGFPNPEYEKTFPDARNRLIDSLSRIKSQSVPTDAGKVGKN